MKIMTLILAATAALSFNANATVIGGSLSDANATQLSTWLGDGNKDFTNIWSGTTGASSIDWHSAVDSAGPTFSIYDITFEGSNYLIGGYTKNDWNGTNEWEADADSFIFNLTTNVKADLTNLSQYATYSDSNYFANFGGGFDISGGYNTLGNTSYAFEGYTFGTTYGGSIIDGVFNPTYKDYFTVNGLETYTISTATAAVNVPEPSSILLMGLGLLGFVGASRRNKKV